ncbi:MAG: hypothetical protein KJ884_14310 [Gammaproteobacteria bacterium]|nr:hypothetical protein [Gammaproteobacteria bacterium]MBU2067623.1 hypothetical protein [Gammaproteobacteria bacterium]MBU2157678.1 hypothetical protein [Gammaproteobacteria bacterium]MBU2324123.1 hypothetical protein [Gammaproteobacteria bacterium]
MPCLALKLAPARPRTKRQQTLGLLLVGVRSRRWPLLLAGAVLILLLLDVLLLSPHLLVQALNPLSTNLAALTLCAVA